ncbi:MAG: RIO-like protein kinase [Parcubacteria group bacterium GW2011_GWC2_39_14]|nr:MAG: RIO-like protein kinase [Parcubacteria group bacterium GW2011_GWC2_39_14]KKR55043.1 MAG: RIO-like protein kinase [Parcubacteria group bacterium GW2011_GWA2_40_23]
MKIDNIEVILEQAKKLNHTLEVISEIKSGKEATVYQVLLDGKLLAMKVYKNQEDKTLKNAGQYLSGKHYAKPSQRRATEKGNKFSKKLNYDNWVKREFYILEKLFKLGAQIPEPILQIENAVFMEYLGDKENSAPRLCDLNLSKKEAEAAFPIVLETALIFWNSGIIHADLSPYNILWWKNKPYVIDFPQAIDKRTNPDALKFLERDLQNVVKHFSKFMEIDYEKIRNQFT